MNLDKEEREECGFDMVRLARVVAPGIPQRITQRGNRRQERFCCAEDYQAYIALIGASCGACEVEVWADCLMPTHVRLIAVPESADGFRRAKGEAHGRDPGRVKLHRGATAR